MDKKNIEREAFEKQWSSDGRYPGAIERSGDGYKFSVTNHDWFTWKLAWQAALASMPTVSREDLAGLLYRTRMAYSEEQARHCPLEVAEAAAILASFPHLESRG